MTEQQLQGPRRGPALPPLLRLSGRPLGRGLLFIHMFHTCENGEAKTAQEHGSSKAAAGTQTQAGWLQKQWVRGLTATYTDRQFNLLSLSFPIC